VDVLVNNLTFFSQPLALVPEDLSLTELLDACLRNVTQEFARKQSAVLVAMGETPPEPAGSAPVIIVKRSFAHRAPRVDADRIRLIQAVEHVLRNGVQWMPQGGRLLVSTADAQAADFPAGGLPPGGAVRIDIQDTGEGIALDLVERITEPFVTTRNVGVGLGLTIVKKIIERHSGRLVIDSTLGRGAKVTLVLPVEVQPHPEDQLVMPPARGSSSAELFHREDDAEAAAGMAAAVERRRRERTAL
jgi:signal transduction histidine kinase